MPVVRINDATFADLSTLKVWLGTKTPSETLDQLVRDAMDRLGLERDEHPDDIALPAVGEAMQFDRAPGLAFTKPMSATIDGKLIDRPTWSSILLEMICQVKSKGVEGEKLVRELSIPTKSTPYEDEGFRYHPKLGISVQGQSASDAWKQVDLLATKWRIPVTVEFLWRANPKAQYPGKSGILRAGV